MEHRGLKRCGKYYYIVRPNSAIEKWADENLVRVKGKLKWLDREKVDKKIDVISDDITSDDLEIKTNQEDPIESSFDKF